MALVEDGVVPGSRQLDMAQLGPEQVAAPFNVEGDGPEPVYVAPDLRVGQLRRLLG